MGHHAGEVPTAPLREPVVVGSTRKGAAAYRAALANTEDSALAKRLAADTLEVPRALVALTWSSAPASTAQANTAREAGLSPGGLSPGPSGGEPRSGAERSEDRREIPLILPMGGPEPEEIPPKRRVCDQAYVARSKLALYPNLVEHNAVEEQFLHRPVVEKDAIIARGKKTGVWDGQTDQEAKAGPTPTSPDRAEE